MNPNLIDILSDHDQEDISLFQSSSYYSTDSYLKLIENRSSTDHFAIFNTNAHSLLKHKSEYDVLLDTINSVNFLDVISFTSGSDNNLDNLIEFDGYTPITKSQGRKVDIAVYVKDTTNYKIRNYLSLPIKKSHLYDGTVIEILQAPKW